MVNDIILNISGGQGITKNIYVSVIRGQYCPPRSPKGILGVF